MNKRFLIIFIALLSGFGLARSQSKSSPREMFLEAESYFLYEEYREALPLYIQLAEIYPLNDNLNYRLGICYLNIPYERKKAIPYLEKASKNINPKYKGDNLKETAAPADAIYYLGDAYRINNLLDKATAAYNRFKQISDPAQFDHEMVNDQIRACENARKLEKHPVKVTYTNLGETINTRFSENNAVVSGDETMLVYSSRLQFYPAVFYTRKVNGNWSSPVNINAELIVDDDCFPVGISYDGKELFLYRSNEFLGDLYVSRFNNGKWSKVKKLNGNINTKFWESHACLSRDGKKLYFTSNRKGTYGGLDVYVSSRDETTQDNWGPALNLGPVINSPLNEETPFIASDDKKLFFSSLGHNGMGGYDVFISELTGDGKWGEPQNIGYPLNTTDHDLFFQPVGDGQEGYMSLFSNDTYGRNDIFRLTITAIPAQLATVNQTLKEPESLVPSSETNRSIIKQNESTEPDNRSMPIAREAEDDQTSLVSYTSLDSESEALDSGKEDTANQALIEQDINDSANVTASDEELNLSPVQKKAWDSLLFGSLGLLAFFVTFFFFLFWRSRKRKNRQNS